MCFVEEECGLFHADGSVLEQERAAERYGGEEHAAAELPEFDRDGLTGGSRVAFGCLVIVCVCVCEKKKTIHCHEDKGKRRFAQMCGAP